jgi:hypothetical protein
MDCNSSEHRKKCHILEAIENDHLKYLHISVKDCRFGAWSYLQFTTLFYDLRCRELN